jgi:putative spermidine/putrescine transport system substrate-binding protein
MEKQDQDRGGSSAAGVSRRGFLSLAAGAAAAGALPRLAWSAGGAKKIVMSQSGGSFMKTWQTAIIDPFQQKTGAQVVQVSGNMSAHALQLRANRASPPFDVFLGFGADFVGLVRDGYLLPLAEDKVPSIRDVHPKFKDQWKGYASYFDYSSIGIAYSTGSVKKPPLSWREFLQRAGAGEFGRTVFFNNLPSAVRGAEVMTMLARVLTGDPTQMDAAFDAVKRLKPYVVKFITSLNDPVTLLLSEEGTIGPGWDGRTYIAHDESGGKVDWIHPKEGVATGAPVIGVVKGGNEEWAYRLVDYALGMEAQKAFCEAMFYGSVNVKVQYSGKLRERIPKPADVIVSNEEFLAANMGKWIERWNREIAA